MKYFGVFCTFAGVICLLAADNVKIAEPPAGTTVATNQLPTGEHVQYFKIMDGARGSSYLLIVTPNGAMKVDGSAVTRAGTVVWQMNVVAPASVGTHGTWGYCGLNLVGTAATAMTLEFSGLLTNEYESVTLTGYDVQ
jgi:hypothetical protein